MTDGATVVGDPEQIYRDLAPTVLGYLRAQGVAEPDDLLGDVFVSVVKDLDRFRGDPGRLRSWVFSIAHARVIDDRRRRRRRQMVLYGEPAEFADRSAPAWPASPDPVLVQALTELTSDQRDVVALRFVADLAVNDVAELLSKRPDAVKALQGRALARLATLLGGGEWSTVR
jgi:RNA polymerase sigma factor (sigma-70 family)